MAAALRRQRGSALLALAAARSADRAAVSAAKPDAPGACARWSAFDGHCRRPVEITVDIDPFADLPA
jgi:hypothetical protein